MQDIINQVKSYLMSKYECHTMIMYGSYADNTFTKESDIDIVCFTDLDTDIKNDTSIVNGKQLDVWIYNTKELGQPEKFLHVLNNRVLIDMEDKAASFIKDIESIFSKGPKVLNDSEKKHLKDWLYKMYYRSQRGDLEGRFRHHWLLTDSLEAYFTLRGLWYMGSKKSFQWLKDNDIKAYNLFDLAYNDEISGLHIKELIDYIVDEN